MLTPDHLSCLNSFLCDDCPEIHRVLLFRQNGSRRECLKFVDTFLKGKTELSVRVTVYCPLPYGYANIRDFRYDSFLCASLQKHEDSISIDVPSGMPILNVTQYLPEEDVIVLWPGYFNYLGGNRFIYEPLTTDLGVKIYEKST